MATVIKTLADASPVPADRLRRLLAMADADIDYSDIPAATEEELVTAVWVEPFEATPAARTPVTLRLKPDVAAWFRAQGQGHTTRMAQVLERYAAFARAREAEKG